MGHCFRDSQYVCSAGRTASGRTLRAPSEQFASRHKVCGFCVYRAGETRRHGERCISVHVGPRYGV
jgi:hypothetical protein